MRNLILLYLIYIASYCGNGLSLRSVAFHGKNAYVSNAPPCFCNKVFGPIFAKYPDYLEDPLEYASAVEYSTGKYPPYPYYDAPRNLFFNRGTNDVVEEDDFEIRRAFLVNSLLRRRGDSAIPLDSSPISRVKRSVSGNYQDYLYIPGNKHLRDLMRTDLAEYDLLCRGIAPWPSYEEIQSEQRAVKTSLFVELESSHHLENLILGKRMFIKDLRTLGDARMEQRRWYERSFEKEWPLTYKEYAALPLDIREAYYANRYCVSTEDERFHMILNYKKSLVNTVHQQHPLEFLHLEDSYTYTPRKSPIHMDLSNWDDPLYAPWRMRTEECIRDCITYDWPPELVRFHTSFDVYDITWLPGAIKIVVENVRNEGHLISDKELKLMLLKIEHRLEELDEQEDIQSVTNHAIMLVARDVRAFQTLSCRRDWNCNVGKRVMLTLSDDSASNISGIMKGSHSSTGLTIEVDGQEQTIALNSYKT
uniref:Uncharacterized protein n=1 Tax=Babesia bovis TaxID=5865 RepID=S6BPP0_BABBO|nr:hypothetical protein [Babesia bovis]